MPWRSIGLTILAVAMLAVATMLALSLRSSWASPTDPLAAQRHNELLATVDWLAEKIDAQPQLQDVDQKLDQLLTNTAGGDSSKAQDVGLQQAVARLEELAKKIEASNSSPPPQSDNAAVQTQLGEIAQKLDQLMTKLDREPVPMKDTPSAAAQTPPASSPTPPASAPPSTPPPSPSPSPPPPEPSPPPKAEPEPSPPPEPLPSIPLSESQKPSTSEIAAVPVGGSTEKPAEQVSRSSELLKPSEEIALRKQRQQDWQQLQELIAAQQWDEALAAVQKIVDLDRLVNGDDPDKLSQSITTLAALYEQREEYEAALVHRQEVAELLLKSCSEQDRRVVDARLSVGWVEALIKLSPEQRKQLADAKSLVAEVQALFKQGSYDEALPIAEQAKEIRKQVLGERHFLYAHSLSDIALLHDYAGRLQEAEPFYNESAAIRRETYGESHPVYVGMLGELYGYYQAFATAQENQGDLMGAAQAWRKMADIGAALYGDEHWQTKNAEGNLQRVERHLKLLELPQEKLDMLAEANQLDQQAAQLFGEQKTEESVALFQKVIELRQQALGPNHAEVAKAQVRLASLYFQLRDPDKSGPLLQQALAIYRADTAQANPEVTASMMNIAVMLLGVEENDKVAALIEEALNIYRTAWGKDNPIVADFMAQQAQTFLNYGAIAQGESLYQGALSTYKTSLGAEHDRYKNAHDQCLNDYRALANHFAGSGDELTAGNFRRLIVDLLVERYGESNWRVADARRELQPGQDSINTDQQNQLLQADTLTVDALDLIGEGQYQHALDPAGQAWQIRQSILTDDHLDTAQSANTLGRIYFSLGEYKKAEEFYNRAKQVRGEQLGVDHPLYANVLNNLAELFRTLGEYDRAEPLYIESLNISQRWKSENQRDYAEALNNLALLYHDTGRFEKAIPLYREALAIDERRAGSNPEDLANTLNNVAGLYRELGDFPSAKTAYLRALEISLGVNGAEHPAHALILNNYAILEQVSKEYEEAEKGYNQAIDILRKQPPEGKNPVYTSTLTNLARLYDDKEQFDEAGKLYQQILEIRRETLGEQSSAFAKSLGNVASHHRVVGEFDEAEKLYLQALGILKEKLGEKHPTYAEMLRNLAKLYDSQGKTAQAVPPLRQAVAIVRESLGQTASVQSEKQQLAMAKSFRGLLDMWLSLSMRAKLPAAETYADVLEWKGAVFARQVKLRDLRRVLKDNPEVANLVEQLKSTSCRIAMLALSDSESRLEELAALNTEQGALEVQLATQSAEYRRQQEVETVTPERLQELIPPQFVLVDLLEYEHGVPPPEGKGAWNTERRVLAFVVRSDQPIQLLDLGAVAPLADAVTAWRGSSSIDRKHPIVGDNDPAVLLLNRIWKPIEKDLQPEDSVLISPDGVLSRFPFCALPGNEPNKYLIEERAVALVPIPRLLPEFLNKSGDEEASLLLIGDVDYDAEVGEQDDARKDSEGGFFGNWSKLEGTRGEIVTIGDSYEYQFEKERREAKSYRRGTASELRFREEANKYRWLHLATHGFFASPDKYSALAPAKGATRGGLSREAESLSSVGVGGYHPGVLSGVVFAGANKPSADGANDGILTALEVAEMDLSNVDVVVMSACETGLGESAGGEGVLGVQRAFQLGGVNTVIGSLWTVDDLATEIMMTTFYDKLWSGDNERKTSKLKAFQQAQLRVLNEGPKRGFVEAEDDKPTDPPRTPPRFWAPFSISGDWR